jgi:hypothetical protein
MAATKYSYSISSDFPNHKVSTDRLTLEIQQSQIVVALDYINTSGDDCDIWFKDALSSGDETILDGVVANHSGEPLAQPPAQTTLAASDGTPVDISNNRMLVVNFPADFGANLWITGRGDDITNGIRGRGDELRMSFDDVVRGGVAEEKHVDIQFMERIQLHDGHLDVPVPTDWSIYDEWDFGTLLEATAVTPNGGNTGNCNLVPMAGGAYNAIIPAAGDGEYDVDLDVAVPVPSLGGGWDYDYKTDVLAFPSDPANTEFALLDIPIQAYVQIAVNMPCSPTGIFDFDAYDTQEISPRWKIRFTVRKKSDGPGDVAGWIVGFRESNTEQ